MSQGQHVEGVTKVQHHKLQGVAGLPIEHKLQPAANCIPDPWRHDAFRTTGPLIRSRHPAVQGQPVLEDAILLLANEGHLSDNWITLEVGDGGPLIGENLHEARSDQLVQHVLTVRSFLNAKIVSKALGINRCSLVF